MDHQHAQHEQHLADLGDEINRVVACTYPVSLQHLDHITAACSKAAIRAWTAQNPALVAPIVTAVIEGLSLQPYSLPILAVLVRERAIRDEALNQSPSLINDLLIQATTSTHGFKTAAATCVALLQHPLPPGHLLPASAHAFFDQIFDQATRKPRQSTLEPLLCLADGACADLFQTFPPDRLDVMRLTLNDVMRSIKSIDGHLLSLYCISLIEMIHRQYIEPPAGNECTHIVSQSTQAPTSSVPKDEAEKFFKGPSADTSIHVSTALVIHACSSDALSIEDAMRIIQLSRRVLGAVDETIRTAWPAKNRPLVTKSHDKIANHRSRSLQLEGISFMVLLRDVKTCTSSAMERFESLLKDFDMDPHPSPDALRVCLHFYAPRLRPSFWKTIVHSLVALDWPIPSILSLSIVVEQLKLLLREYASIAKELTGAIKSLAPQLNRFLSSVTSTAVDSGPVRSFKALVMDLFLSALFVAPEQGSNLNAAEKLIDKLRLMAIETLRLPPKKLARRSAVISSLPEVPATPEKGASLHWRKNLRMRLPDLPKSTLDSVTQVVTVICRDLEDRCDTVEEHLHHARSEVDQLTAKLATLSTAHTSIETQLVEALDAGKRSSEAVNDFQLRYDAQQKLHQEASDKSSARITELEHAHELLVTQMKKTESLKNEAQAEYDVAQTENSRLVERNERLADRVRAHQRSIQELEDKEAAAQEKLMFLQVTQALTEEQAATLSEAVLQKDKDYSALQLMHEEAEKLHAKVAADTDAERLALQNCIKVLESTLADARTEQNQVYSTHENAQAALYVQLATAQSELEQASTISKSLSEQLESLQTEHRKAVDTLECQVTDKDAQSAQLQKDLDETRLKLDRACNRHDSLEREYIVFQEDFAAAAQQHRAATEELEQRLKVALRQCHEKQMELDRAHEMRLQMISVMGISAAAPPRSAVDQAHDLQDASHATTQAPAMRRRTRKTTIVTSRSSITPPSAASFQSQSGSSPTGTTPKRQKPRKSFKIPILKRAASSPQRSGRAALQPVSANLANVAVVQRPLQGAAKPQTPKRLEAKTSVHEDEDYFGTEDDEDVAADDLIGLVPSNTCSMGHSAMPDNSMSFDEFLNSATEL